MHSKITSENHLDQHEAKWFAVYTRYKREKLVHKRLKEKGVECFLPIQKVTRYYTRKVKKLELPLLSCYVFTKITKSEYVPVLDTSDVVGFVKIANNLISIPQNEIDILRRIVGENIETEVIQSTNLAAGDKVEVIYGPLTGLQGHLIEKRNANKFVIALNQLGYSLCMQVERNHLRKLSYTRTGSR